MTDPSKHVLGYSSPRNGRVPVVAHDEDGVTITIPTARSAGRLALAITGTDLFGFLLAPFGWLAFHLLATKRPRAIVRLSRTKLSIAETDDNGLGLVTRRRSWPLLDVGELRPNRFGPALYVTIRRRDSFDLFADLPADAIRSVADTLAAARDRV